MPAFRRGYCDKFGFTCRDARKNPPGFRFSLSTSGTMQTMSSVESIAADSGDAYAYRSESELHRIPRISGRIADHFLKREIRNMI